MHRQAERAGVGGAARARRRLSRQPARVPQMMTPPPRLSRRARICSIPAAAHQPRTSSRGCSLPEPLDARAEEPAGADPRGRRRGRRRAAGRRASTAARPGAPRRAARRTRATPSCLRAGPRPRARRASPAGRPRSAGGRCASGRRPSRPRAGSRSAWPSTSSIRSVSPAASTRRAPPASISGLWSTPTTRHGYRRARAMATAAVPVAMSATTAPSRSAAGAMASIMRSCQRRSCPKERSCAQRS